MCFSIHVLNHGLSITMVLKVKSFYSHGNHKPLLWKAREKCSPYRQLESWQYYSHLYLEVQESKTPHAFSPSFIVTIANYGHVWAHAYGRRWLPLFSEYATQLWQHEQQFEEMWLAGFMCFLGAHVCLHYNQSVGSCCMIEENWLVDENWPRPNREKIVRIFVRIT